jgi:hypothetical protein
MAVPLIAWGVGALILWAMKSKAPVTPKTPPGSNDGTNAAPAAAAPFVSRIQKCLLAFGFTGDGALTVNGREDISTQLALQSYWAARGGYVPLSYQQLAERMESELAGKAAPSLAYTPTAAILARIKTALAKLGFTNIADWYLSKGMFPPDAGTASDWELMAKQVETAVALFVGSLATRKKK